MEREVVAAGQLPQQGMLHIQVRGASHGAAPAEGGNAAAEAGSAAGGAVTDAVPSEKEIRFFSGNPLVKTLRGTIRLFLDAPGAGGFEPEGAAGGRRRESRLVCIFAVPSHMSAPELLDFVGRDVEAVEQVRLVRDDEPFRFMALLQFVVAPAAAAFLHRVNGQPFNTIEPERCHAYFVETVQFVDEAGAVESTHVGSLDAGSGADPLRAFPLVKQDVRELPKCPVCLERLDTDVSGVVTTMCNHTFHCDCLSGWRDSTCPVCRYCAQDAPSFHACEVCGAQTNVWMCLVCGFAGCGRYERRHMYEHYESTGHAYCIHLETQRVWDYAGDGYVHRLVVNKLDGKMIELPDPGTAAAGAADGTRSQRPTLTDAVSDSLQKEKLQSIALEYEYLLVSQLETQQEWYEARMAAVREEAGAAEQRAAEAERAMGEEQRRAAAKTKEATKLRKENEFLRELNRTVLRDQQRHREELEAARADVDRAREEGKGRIAELEAQVRDLMVYLDTQERVERSAMRDEIRSGAMLVGESDAPTRRRGRRR